MDQPESSEPTSLIGARRDLCHAEQLLARGRDRLVAIVAVARAAKRADEATFALLENPRRTRRKNSGKYPSGV